MPAMITQKRLTSYFYLLINTLVWGAAFIFVKPALNITSPFRYLFYRYLIAAPLALPFLIFNWSKVKNHRQLLNRVILIELIGTSLILAILYQGLKLTSAIEANLITSTTPIFITLGAIIFLKEKQQKHEWQGLLISFIGVIILILIPIFYRQKQIIQISLLGNFLILLNNIGNVIYFLLAKKYYHHYPKLLVTSLSFCLGLVSFGILSFWESSTNLASFFHLINQELSHASVLIASLYMGIFGSIIGLTAYIKGQDGIEASEASLFNYLQPLVAIPLGIILLQEQLYSIQIVSLILIIVGVIWAEKR